MPLNATRCVPALDRTSGNGLRSTILVANERERRRPNDLGRGDLTRQCGCAGSQSNARMRRPSPATTTTRTWDALDRRTNRLARGLEARGVREGRFVTIGLPNGVAFVEACVACWKLGATPQPVSSRLPVAELDAIVELADPAVVVRARPG